MDRNSGLSRSGSGLSRITVMQRVIVAASLGFASFKDHCRIEQAMSRRAYAAGALRWGETQRLGQKAQNTKLQGTPQMYLLFAVAGRFENSRRARRRHGGAPELSRCTKPLRGSLPTVKPCQ